MTWFFWGVYAAICLAIVNSFIRANPWELSLWAMVLIVTPVTALGTQLGFTQFYWGAPSFTFAWFTGAGMTAIAGFISAVFIFHEQPNFVNITGICLIILGSWLLNQ